MKYTVSLLAILFINTIVVCAQVGIDTASPNVTFQIDGKPDSISTADGLMAPRITLQKLIAKNVYNVVHTGAIIYVTDLNGVSSNSTAAVKEVGYYYFNGSSWVSMTAPEATFQTGDIKTSIRTADHSGWILLNGRAISLLTTSQQSAAQALGLNSVLPDASDAVLLQNAQPLGSVTGSNLKIITRAQLPNTRITTSTNGLHNHAFEFKAGAQSATTNPDQLIGGNDGLGTLNTKITNDNGAHAHFLSLNGDVPQQELDVTPRALSVNTFIYLGQ